MVEGAVGTRFALITAQSLTDRSDRRDDDRYAGRSGGGYKDPVVGCDVEKVTIRAACSNFRTMTMVSGPYNSFLHFGRISPDVELVAT